MFFVRFFDQELRNVDGIQEEKQMLSHRFSARALCFAQAAMLAPLLASAYVAPGFAPSMGFNRALRTGAGLASRSYVVVPTKKAAVRSRLSGISSLRASYSTTEKGSFPSEVRVQTWTISQGPVMHAHPALLQVSISSVPLETFWKRMIFFLPIRNARSSPMPGRSGQTLNPGTWKRGKGAGN
jgi:hypothetical protein